MKHGNLILLIVAIIIIIIPMGIYSGLGEDQGYFGGSDGSGADVILESGYKPWFNSFWEPPSGEIECLLFALQAAFGALIIGFTIGYWRGQANKNVK